MYAIRGAINCTGNTAAAIDEAAAALFSHIMNDLDLKESSIVSIIISATPDLTAKYPCETIRKLGFNNTALLCVTEMEIDNAIPFTIRMLFHCRGKGVTRFYYLRDTLSLRK